MDAVVNYKTDLYKKAIRNILLFFAIKTLRNHRIVSQEHLILFLFLNVVIQNIYSLVAVSDVTVVIK